MINQMFQNGFRQVVGLAPAQAQDPSILWAVGTMLILFPVFVFALTTCWFMAGGIVSPGFSWSVLVVSAAGALGSAARLFPGTSPQAPLIAAVLGLLAAFGAGIFHDTSMDGQQYHFQAIYALAEGWNPIYKPAAAPVIGDEITPWAVHYPRAVWVFSSTLLSAGLPLGMVKLTNLLVLFGATAMTGAALYRTGFSRLFSLVLTAAAVLNPVVLSQVWTSMNDGLLNLCILIFVLSLAAWVREGSRAALVAGIAAMALALNLKFSGIPTFVFLCAFACLGAFIVGRWPKATTTAAILLTSATAAIFVLGWSPYMQNFLDHGHVFHPIMGRDAIDIMSGVGPALDNTPDVLLDKSAVERFFFSLFSQTHAGYDTVAHIKLPFSLSLEEVRAAGGVDVRLAGFGPLFSGAVVLSLIAAGLLALYRKDCGPVTHALLFVAAALLVSVLLMPQNWWARYVPQFWLVPVCVAAATLTMKQRGLNALGVSIIAVMLGNAALAGGASTWLTAGRSAEVDAQVARLAQTGERYCMVPEMVQSRIFLMQKAGIETQYISAENIACEAPESVAAYGPDRTGGKICPCAN